ncbi:M20/M25/M40 family metallo-hydrolase [Sphingomonas japonica]|uniref:Zn-dependent M28 family amino/carboxypeptidase n=1 Tax=Sphingomonas japonica TaxID=511662 RepID=A0ABX0U3L2_9SPHN|nr:M20/M25/M40 family metallo-hydrolase [Sphingomonas japonica]NIJ23892.1 Zn-dependent M28 family amino/carboxypeptidase [Sphingomonas japonica]
MRTLSLGIAFSLLASSSLTLAQTTTPDFSAERFKTDLTWLADDAREGRDAGTPGYDAAAKYVSDRFAELGLKPANADAWYQEVPFVERATDTAAPATMTIGGKTYTHGDQVLAGTTGEGKQTVATDAVFVGYGLTSPEHKIDDYAGLDVKGKTVVMFYGAPKSLPSDVAAAMNNSKGKLAAANGAVGVITLLPTEMAKKFPWEMIKQQSSHPSLNWMNPDGTPYRESMGIQAQGLLTAPAAEALFAGAPATYAATLAAVDKGEAPKGFALKQPVKIEGTTKWRRFESPNVVGMIPGSDPALAGEAVLLMAHLDHNGVDPETEGPDKIYNGAMDNASGVATMLEVARAFTKAGAAPKRTVMFAAVTAEEDGLLGSQYLAKHPLPGHKVVSVVNLDMPVLLYDFQDVVAFGAEHSTMGPMVDAAAKEAGLTLSPDPMPEENLFVRSDHYSFVKEGVPSVFLVTGFKNGGEEAFKKFLATDYHKPSDQVTLPINWESGAKFAKVNYAIARQIADAPTAPQWYSDSPFGKQYAPTAAKAERPAGVAKLTAAK